MVERLERGEDTVATEGRDWRSDVKVATACLSTAAVSSAEALRLPLSTLLPLGRLASCWRLRD